MFPSQSYSCYSNPYTFFYIIPYIQYNTPQDTLVKQGIYTQNSISEGFMNINHHPQQTLQDAAQILVPKQKYSKKIKKLSFKQDEDSTSQFNPRKLKNNNLKKKSKGKQNQNRNVIPNIIHQAFSYLAKSKKSLNLLERIFSYIPTPNQATIFRFYIFQKKIKEKMNHYLSQDSLSLFNKLVDPDYNIFSLEEQQYYLKISRIMISYFLKNLSSLVTLTSKRMSKEKRTQHLKIRRYLVEKVDQIFQ